MAFPDVVMLSNTVKSFGRKLFQAKASTKSRMGTSYQICKSNHTLFFVFFFFKEMIHSLSCFFTRSTDARLQYLGERKQAQKGVITNVQLTVKMQSMMLLMLYMVKNKIYLHIYTK